MLYSAVAKHLPTVVPGLVYDPTGTTGNVFVALMPSTPDVAVAVMPAGGAPQPTLDPSDHPAVQILVRGPEHDPRPGLQLAGDIYGALQALDLTRLDPGGPDEVLVITCDARQTGPIPMGPDANDRHEWSLNFDFVVSAPTVHRPLTPT